MDAAAARVLPAELTEKVWSWVEQRQIQDKHIAALQQNSPLGKILAAGSPTGIATARIIKESIEDTGRHVVHELERFIDALGTIASISPLMGLLGTVLGMIRTFNALTTGGVGQSGGAGRRHRRGADHDRGRPHRGDSRAARLTSTCAAASTSWSCRWRRKPSSWCEAIEASARTAPAQRALSRIMNLQPRAQRRAGSEPDLADRRGAAAADLLHGVDDLRRRIAHPDAVAAGERRSRAADQQKDPIEVTVTASGEYRVNGQTLINTSPATLSAAVSRLAGEARDTPITIRADARATHQSVVTAMDVVGRLGFRAHQHRDRQRAAAMRPADSGASADVIVPIAERSRRCRPTPGRPIGACSAICGRIAACSCSACSARMLFSASMVSFTPFAKLFGDGTFENRDPRTIVWLPLALVALFLLRGLGDFTQTYCMGYVGRHIVKRLREQIFERITAAAGRLLRPQLQRRAAVAPDLQHRADRAGGAPIRSRCRCARR